MKTMTRLLAVVALGIALSFTGSSAPAASEAPPTRIAVVNIIKIFNALDIKKNGDIELDRLKVQLDNERKAKEDEVEKLKGSLSDWKPDSDDYKQATEKLMRKAIDLKFFAAYSEQKLLMEARLRMAVIYRSMNKSIEDFSRANGVALVLASDDPDLSQVRNQEDLVARITNRKVIYAHESLDITKLIIDKMNTDAKAIPEAPTH